MPRILLVALAAAALLLLPAAADAQSGVRLRGTVTLKNTARGLVGVRAARQAVVLRVPGSLARIRVGQRVELRGTTLRARANGSRVLARGVSIVRSRPLARSAPATPSASASDDDLKVDDELEIKGTITSLAPLTVASGTETATCVVPAGVSLAGFAVGDLVEMTCDLSGGVFVLRELEQEDDDDSSGPGSGDDDDDDDSSGPGSGDGDGDDNGDD